MKTNARPFSSAQKVALCIVVFSVISIGALAFAPAVSAQGPTNREFVVVASQYAFDPNFINVNFGDNVTIRLRSADVAHGMYIDGYDINIKLFPESPSDEVVVTFVANRAGVFRYRCSITCGGYHPFMMGKLTVEPGYEFPISIVLAWGIAMGSIGVYWKGRFEPIEEPEPVEKIDLLKFKLIKKLLKSRNIQFTILLATLAIFVFVIMSGLVGTPVGNRNFSVVMVWIIWWGALMIFMVPIGGRLWCMVCPLPAMGEWAQRGSLTTKNEKPHGLMKKWPKKLDNIWLQNAGFLSMTIFIGIMMISSLATALLMLLLIVLPLALSFVFKDRVFCRYLCPVSGFIGLYANAGMLELRVKDRAVCKKHIESKDCIQGNENGYGCPWFEFPQNLDRNAYCGLCLECIKTCPKDNIALNFRLGGEDLEIDPWAGRKKRKLDEAWKAFIMLTLAFLYGITFMGPYSFLKDMARIASLNEWLSFIILVWGMALIVVPGIFVGFTAIAKRASGNKEITLKKLVINYANALVPLGLLAWIAFSVAIVMIQGSLLIPVIADPFGWGWDIFALVGNPFGLGIDYPWQPYFTTFVPFIQMAILLGGLFLAVRASYQIGLRVFKDRAQAVKGSIPIIVFMTLFTMVLLWHWTGG